MVVNQINRSYQARDLKMTTYLKKALELKEQFKEFNIEQIPRDENSHADALANLGSAVQVTKSQTIPIIYLKWPIIWKQDQEAACEINIETTWMTPIFDYLQNNTLPEDKDAARKIKATSARFTIIQGNLYRRSFSGPYLTCIKPSQVKTILSEIHEGECGNHSGPRSLAHKVITTGYYWPTLRADCKEFTKKCAKCQRFVNMPNQPPERLIHITSPWPFMK